MSPARSPDPSHNSRDTLPLAEGSYRYSEPPTRLAFSNSHRPARPAASPVARTPRISLSAPPVPPVQPDTWPYYPGHSRPSIPPPQVPLPQLPPGSFRGYVVYPELSRLPADLNTLDPTGRPRTVLVPPRVMKHLLVGGQMEITTPDGSRTWKASLNQRLSGPQGDVARRESMPITAPLSIRPIPVDLSVERGIKRCRSAEPRLPTHGEFDYAEDVTFVPTQSKRPCLPESRDSNRPLP